MTVRPQDAVAGRLSRLRLQPLLGLPVRGLDGGLVDACARSDDAGWLREAHRKAGSLANAMRMSAAGLRAKAGVPLAV